MWIGSKALVAALLLWPASALAIGMDGIEGGNRDGISFFKLAKQFPLVADGIAASIDLNFVTDQGWSGGVLSNSTAPLTVTRASPGTAQWADGHWSQFANNVARRTDLGLLNEEPRTNSLRNNSMVGASPPSTSPTYWTNNATAGLTVTVNSVGIDQGMNYIEYGASGTATTGLWRLVIETVTGIAAASGQSWTGSFFYRFVGPTTNTTSTRLTVTGLNSAGGISETFLGVQDNSLSTTYKQVLNSVALADPTTTNIRPLIDVVVTNGATVNFVIRFAWPQFEQGTFPTSPIVTSGTAVARLVDQVSMPITLGSAFTLFGSGTPLGSSGTFQTLVSIDDNTNSNRCQILRAVSVTRAQTNILVAGTSYLNANLLTWTQGVPAKIAVAAQASDQATVKDGTTVQNYTNAGPILSVPNFRVGSGVNVGGLPWDGYVARAALWLNNRTSNAGLQQITTP
jgi:hypothetical protein